MVTKNPSGTQTIELNETNEQGIGIEKIVKTPFEITLYDTYPDTVHSYDYYAAILDADGNLLSSGSGGFHEYGSNQWGGRLHSRYLYL